MALHAIGKAIREARIAQHISQETLCEGICTTANLSKIENGRQIPNYIKLKKLTDRLGIDISDYNIPISDADFEREKIEQQINTMIINKNYDYDNLLEQYMAIKGDEEPDEQFYLYSKTVQQESEKGYSEEIINNYVKALKLTYKSFEIDKPLSQPLLTNQEIDILYKIAYISNSLNKKIRAIRILEFLKDYFDKRTISDEKTAYLYPNICFTLSTYLERNDDWEYGGKVCDDGIEYCRIHGRSVCLHHLLFNKGCSLASLGQKEDAKEKISIAFALRKAFLKTKEEKTEEEKKQAWLAYACNKNLGLDLPISIELDMKEKDKYIWEKK